MSKNQRVVFWLNIELFMEGVTLRHSVRYGYFER